ncbi:energy transducer TonB [Flavobacterium sp. SUN052]|uniref:energy transducer TonB n=1 Tax=Flavobacterium sp. SUN052 TaxID=3002441 RepID=UPI00237E166C|nr:energy transducer TonB [Flavobacterium sp. SUN052]MEC4003870.1 energy transducer TonB [Flavobacterium sp. SUN052]
MSNVSIFEKKWLDLVFEGKNQKYGAYQLRRESSKTTLIAFLFGILFLGGGTFLLSSFAAKPDIEIRVPVVLPPSVKPPVTIIEDKHEIVKPKTETAKSKAAVDNKNYVVDKTKNAVVDVALTIKNPTPNVPTSPTGGGTGAPTDGPSTIFVPSTPVILAPDNGPYDKSNLDKQPVFPGGIKNFYEYVGRNFEKQEVEEDGEAIKVFVSFVIERNGTMTDIEIVKKTNDVIDKEAIRVLKSLKTKWEPGMKNGQPVRTQYTLPITVMM